MNPIWKNKEIKTYFHQVGFIRFFQELKKKYCSFGSCRGTVKLININEVEQKNLSLFLSENYQQSSTITISLKKFQRAIDESKFSGITLDELINLYFEEPILTNLTTKNLKKEKQMIFFQKLIQNFKDTKAESWFQNLIDKKNNTYVKIIQQFEINKKETSKNLEIIACALNLFPLEESMSLPNFSSDMTHNPHFFDLDTPNCNLLLDAISFSLNKTYQNNHQSKMELLELVGIISEETTNYCITYGLKGNEALNWFYANHTPAIITLSHLKKMSKIETIHQIVFVLENPSILSKVMLKKIQASFIITSGIPNLVVYKLLESLGNIPIYYNGDFDPEGLLIASMIKKRFPEQFHFLNYDLSSYEKTKSSQIISESSLKKLNRIHDLELQEIKNILFTTKIAGYQEKNYEILIQQIENMIK